MRLASDIVVDGLRTLELPLPCVARSILICFKTGDRNKRVHLPVRLHSKQKARLGYVNVIGLPKVAA
jgi:hypothetical protein